MIDEGNASEFGAEYAPRVKNQMKLHSPIWIKEIYIFCSSHQKTLTHHFGVYPTGNNIDSLSSDRLRAARFLRWYHPTSLLAVSLQRLLFLSVAGYFGGTRSTE